MTPIIWRAVRLPFGLSLLAAFLSGVLFLGHPLLGAFFFFVASILLFDVNGRVRDLKYLLRISPKVRKFLYGRYANTACGRQVMIAVEPRAYFAYYDAGYRWYHILPDYALTRNSPFLKRTFWRQLFSGQRSL
jgi:hypothetical protein